MYTNKDIEVLTSFYDRHGLQMSYSNLKTDASALLFLSTASLTAALYSVGYITDYDKELVCVPMPTDRSEGVHNWINLEDFIRNNSDAYGNLDKQIALNLVVNHRNNSSKPQTTLS